MVFSVNSERNNLRHGIVQWNSNPSRNFKSETSPTLTQMTPQKCGSTCNKHFPAGKKTAYAYDQHMLCFGAGLCCVFFPAGPSGVKSAAVDVCDIHRLTIQTSIRSKCACFLFFLADGTVDAFRLEVRNSNSKKFNFQLAMERSTDSEEANQGQMKSIRKKGRK